MSAIVLKVKNYRGAVNIINNSNIRARILHILLFSFGVLSIIYIALLGTMVYNVLERKTLEVKALSLSNIVADLEISYLSISNKIDLDFSHSLGFKEAKATFATRKSLGSVKVDQNEI